MKDNILKMLIAKIPFLSTKVDENTTDAELDNLVYEMPEIVEGATVEKKAVMSDEDKAAIVADLKAQLVAEITVNANAILTVKEDLAALNTMVAESEQASISEKEKADNESITILKDIQSKIAANSQKVGAIVGQEGTFEKPNPAPADIASDGKKSVTIKV